ILEDKRFDKNMVNAVHSNGLTALLYAIEKNHTEAAKLLLADERVDVNICNADGFTALMMLAKDSSKSEVITKLLLAHPDLDIEKQAEIKHLFRTAWQIAKNNNNQKMMDLITAEKLNRYGNELSNRTEQYNPDTEFLRNFSIFKIFSKDEKMSALNNGLKTAMENHTKITNAEYLAALRDGKLGEIVDGFS